MDHKVQGGTKPHKFEIYQFKITLKSITPPIWRRLLVSSEKTLDDLHTIIQYTMEWLNHYLYSFEQKDKVYRSPEICTQNGHIHVSRETSIQLLDLNIKPKESFLYIYEWGERWEHEVLVEAIQLTNDFIPYAHCLDGKRACPPEECGGIEGYKQLLQSINHGNPGINEWLPRDFDPEYFDKDLVNQILFDHFGQAYKRIKFH
jgi:hypothetical protein